MITRIQVCWFLRKSQPSFKSIEIVFSSLEPIISKHVQLHKKELPEAKASIKGIFTNLVFTKKNKSNINHITGHNNYIAITSGRNTIITIHDLESAFEGPFFKKLFILIFWFWVPSIMVKRVTVISNHTKLKLSQSIPFAKKKIRVIYNPVGAEFSASSYAFKKECPVILCMGTKSNKNLELVIDSVVGLNCVLHIVGALSVIQKNKLLDLKINYINGVYLSREAIVQAYRDCDLLCFPSTYEGFGMPIIEAQATGRPVITSNLGAMKEVAGDSACLVDPLDKASIRAGLEQIILNAEYRDQLIAQGFDNVKRFSLERIAQQYMDLYQELTPQ